MKKILITTLILVTYSSNALANDNLKLNDSGASLKLATIDMGGMYNDMFGISATNTGASKRSAFSQNESGITNIGNESELGLSYDHAINSKVNTNFKLMYRNDVNNMLGASDSAAMFRLNYKLN